MNFIREFKKKDLQDVTSLIKNLDYDLSPETAIKNINLFLENKNNKIFVCDIEGKIIGYIAAAIHHLLVTEFFRCRIENLVVNPEFRRRGVASDLLTAVENYALAKKISIIDVTSSKKREIEGAYAFYEKFGYQNQDKDSSQERRSYFRKRIR